MMDRTVSRRRFVSLALLSTGLVATAGLAACQPAAAPSPAAPSGGSAPGQAAPAAPKSLTTVNVLIPIAVTSGAMLQAMHRGYMAAEGLEIAVQEFASGTTALETWQTGVGHMIHTGDLPAVVFWIKNPTEYGVLSSYERSAARYIAITKADIKTPQDLVGKTIATRVGSTGSYMISRYLKKNNIDASKVTIVNLDNDKMAPAIDRGDIDAFFTWEPFGTLSLRTSGNKVHQLTTAEGYVRGYSLIGGRPSWIQSNTALASGYLRALMKMTAQYGDQATRAEMATLTKQRWGMEPEDTDAQIKLMGWALYLDKIFYDDFTDQVGWAKEAGFVPPDKKLVFKQWTIPGPLRGADPARVEEPPVESA
ncbi:MAG: ABC transporter substrate-binding protein [Chloroflexi bacterium]|nr:ABC transporter substrate-binding protein [Chloroflexota bacterium]